MEMILTILGGILGIVVPTLFAYGFIVGINHSPVDEAKKAMYKRNVILITVGWTAVVWIMSLTGFVNYHVGDMLPRVVLPLFLPVIIALLLLMHPTVKMILDNTPLATLVGIQTFRLAGFVFLIIPGLGQLPQAFVSGGYGDIATGILAICAAMMLAKHSSSGKGLFVLFTLVGMLDLLNVASLLLYYYPSWNAAVPSSAALADFSLVMVPALAAPMALILHLYAIRNYCIKKG